MARSNDNSSSDEEEYKKYSSISSITAIDAAPDVGYDDHERGTLYVAPTATELTVNVPYDDLMRPAYGPQRPNEQSRIKKNILTGHVDQESMSEMNFRTQHQLFESHGYSYDPTIRGAGMDAGYIGDTAKAALAGGATIFGRAPGERKRKEEIRKKRQSKGNLDEVDGENAYKGPWAEYTIDKSPADAIDSPEEEEQIAVSLDTTPQAPPADDKKETKKRRTNKKDSTTFHGESEYDYLGRTYMRIPTDVDVNLEKEPGNQRCFIPKKLIHTWDGHAKGVSAIRFLPKSAHLLLSAGMDNKLKIWDVYHDRRLLRTMMGHTKAVKDIAFNNDGSRFLSTSYDHFIKLWDTETGQCIRTFPDSDSPRRRVANCVAFYPNKNKMFIAGYSDKSIVHYNAETGKIVQTCKQHLGEVNTVMFIKGNKYATTSEDKKMLIWEEQIDAVTKYNTDDNMNSMPAVAVDTKRNWLAYQSLDNRIVVYNAKDNCRINRQKEFKGHVVGATIKPGFSPDGRFISSGDCEGNVFVWDWKECIVRKKFKAHDKYTVNTEWHPHETSRMATCSSYDGKIKYWD